MCLRYTKRTPGQGANSFCCIAVPFFPSCAPASCESHFSSAIVQCWKVVDLEGFPCSARSRRWRKKCLCTVILEEFTCGAGIRRQKESVYEATHEYRNHLKKQGKTQQSELYESQSGIRNMRGVIHKQRIRNRNRTMPIRGNEFHKCERRTQDIGETHAYRKGSRRRGRTSPSTANVRNSRIQGPEEEEEQVTAQPMWGKTAKVM